MTLRRRLLYLILAMLPLALLVGGVLTYFYSIRLVQEEMAGAVELGETTVKEVVDTLPMSADPAAQIAKIVASFDLDRDVRVSHIAPDGRVISASRLAPISNPPPTWLYDALVSDLPGKTITLPDQLAKLGSIRIEPTPINEISEVWEEMTLQFLSMAAFISIILWLVTWTLDRALRPLDNLSSALAQVGAGNYTAKIPETGPQELASIYREFNRMSARLKDAERQNRTLNNQLSNVQEEERADLARDLHDEIGPFLFAVDVDAQTIPQYLQRGKPDEIAGRAQSIRQSVAHMQTHLRAILGRLRPAALLDLGLAHAADHLVAFWKNRHPEINIAADVAQTSFGAELDEVAYRIIQEALSNAIRHGKPSRIEISATVNAANALVVTVTDNGSGIAADATPGFGLSGMRDRVATLGGTLDIQKGPGDIGTKILAVLPARATPGTRLAKIKERAFAS